MATAQVDVGEHPMSLKDWLEMAVSEKNVDTTQSGQAFTGSTWEGTDHRVHSDQSKEDTPIRMTYQNGVIRFAMYKNAFREMNARTYTWFLINYPETLGKVTWSGTD